MPKLNHRDSLDSNEKGRVKTREKENKQREGLNKRKTDRTENQGSIIAVLS